MSCRNTTAPNFDLRTLETLADLTAKCPNQIKSQPLSPRRPDHRLQNSPDAIEWLLHPEDLLSREDESAGKQYCQKPGSELRRAPHAKLHAVISFCCKRLLSVKLDVPIFARLTPAPNRPQKTELNEPDAFQMPPPAMCPNPS